MSNELYAIVGAFVGGLLVNFVFFIADRRHHNRMMAKFEEGNREVFNWLKEIHMPTQAEIDAVGKAEGNDI